MIDFVDSVKCVLRESPLLGRGVREALRLLDNRSVATATATSTDIACDGGGLLQRGLQTQVGSGQLTGGTGAELQALDVLADTELVNALCTTPVLNPYGEDGEVGNLHVLALQQQLLDAAAHVGEHPLDGSLRERGVVVRHVLGQSFERYGLLNHRVGEILAVG